MKYGEDTTRAASRRRSARVLRKRNAARWRAAGRARDGFEYPAGVWADNEVGSGRHVRPELCIATHGGRVRRGRRNTPRAGKFYVEDPDGEEVLESELEAEGADDE